MTTLNLTADQLQIAAQAIDAQMRAVAEHAGHCLAGQRRAAPVSSEDAALFGFICQDDDTRAEDAWKRYLDLAVTLDAIKTAAGLLAWTTEEHRDAFDATVAHVAEAVA